MFYNLRFIVGDKINIIPSATTGYMRRRVKVLSSVSTVRSAGSSFRSLSTSSTINKTDDKIGNSSNNNNQRATMRGTTTTRKTKNLNELWPLLQHRFEDLADENGNFPLRYTFNENWKKKKKSSSSSKQQHQHEHPSRQAAVLLLVCSVDNEPSILFTKRSSDLKSHAAEVSFPGGHYEPSIDKCLIDTAIREMEEELLPSNPGLIENHIQILGKTTWLPSLNLTPVTPVIAVLLDEELSSSHSNNNDYLSSVFPGDPSEVELVFTVPIQNLLNEETNHTIPNNRFGIKESPLYPSPQGNIWGLTAFILRPVLHRLFQPILYYEDNKHEQEGGS